MRSGHKNIIQTVLGPAASQPVKKCESVLFFWFCHLWNYVANIRLFNNIIPEIKKNLGTWAHPIPAVPPLMSLVDLKSLSILAKVNAEVRFT